MVAAVENPTCIDNMKAFAQTGLTCEVANPRFELMEATIRLTDKVPDLRIVLGHLQALPLPAAPDLMKSYSKNLRELSKPKLYAKISGLPRKAGATPAAGWPEFDPAVYHPMLDFICDIFGEDCIVYAGRSRATLEILRAHFTGKGQSVAAPIGFGSGA
jgi:predicted TIM-barrel fold metal-dependent hydrolase